MRLRKLLDMSGWERKLHKTLSINFFSQTAHSNNFLIFLLSLLSSALFFNCKASFTNPNIWSEQRDARREMLYHRSKSEREGGLRRFFGIGWLGKITTTCRNILPKSSYFIGFLLFLPFASFSCFGWLAYVISQEEDLCSSKCLMI